MDPARRGYPVQTEDGGDLVDRHPLDVVEAEHHSILRLQVPERIRERVLEVLRVALEQVQGLRISEGDALVLAPFT